MFKQLTHEEAAKIITESSPVIADVRDLESYEHSHIPGAIHLSMVKLQEFCDNNLKDQTIILYCFHGISSQSVAQHLVDQGFSHVYSLSGGFEAWKSHQTSNEDES